MYRTHKMITCKICGEKIDRGACDNDYTILTEIDNRPEPISKKTSYICTGCSYKIRIAISDAVLENIESR